MLEVMKNLLFANRNLCYLCREEYIIESGYICRECYEKLDILDAEIEIDSPYLDRVYYSLFYNRFIKEKMANYKFTGKNYLYKPFGQIMTNTIRNFSIQDEIDFLLYIPSHRRKEAKRGYNQAELLAQYIGINLGKDISRGNLIKIKETRQQSGLNRLDRRTNLKDAFKIKDSKEIKNRKILLIDDIITTGTTMEECSRILKENGAEKIIGLTLTSTKKQ